MSKFWQNLARFRLYRNRFLSVDNIIISSTHSIHFTAFFQISTTLFISTERCGEKQIISTVVFEFSDLIDLENANVGVQECRSAQIL